MTAHRAIANVLVVAAFAGALGATHCGSGSDDGSPATAPDGGSPDAIAATDDAGSRTSACSSDALAVPASSTTYYVAANEPGADDATCDGRAPTNESAGHCPWKSLAPVQAKNVLVNVASTSVLLRAGTYIVEGFAGLLVQGTGATESERVYFGRYKDEVAILDIGAPTGAGCDGDDAAAFPPACVRQVVRISGTYVTVQGLRIQNGLAYQLEVNGGAHHAVRCNDFDETAVFSGRSDQLKLDGHSTDVVIDHNHFTHWRSQAIDITEVDHVTIEDNELDHPADTGCGATGGKYGAHDITIRHNAIHDIASPECDQAQSFLSVGGGTGTPHPETYEAENIHIVENHYWNARAKLVHFVSCKDCSFERNDVRGVGAGMLVEASANGLPECSGSPTGCLPTVGLVLAGNRFANIDGKGDPTQANLFAGADPAAGAFTAGTNLYCAPSAADARFVWNGANVDFAGWTAATGTDTTSSIADATDPRCAGW